MPDPKTPPLYERRLELHEIEKIEEQGDYLHLTYDTGWSFAIASSRLARRPVVGRMYYLELRGFSRITGMQDDEGWLYHDSEKALREESERQQRAFEEKSRAMVEKFRASWSAQEAELPDWLRARIEKLRENGPAFEVDGWGYELAICRLAEAYDAEDQARVDELDKEMGCSGNQHSFAKLLVETHSIGAGSDGRPVSALSPLTGDPYYQGK